MHGSNSALPLPTGVWTMRQLNRRIQLWLSDHAQMFVPLSPVGKYCYNTAVARDHGRWRYFKTISVSKIQAIVLEDDYSDSYLEK